MKICVLDSSRELSNSPDTGFFSDASQHIPDSRHNFVTTHVTEANVVGQIEDLLKEGYDLFINNLLCDDAARQQVSSFLASKDVLTLSNPSSILKESEAGLAKAAKNYGLRVGTNIKRNTEDSRCSVIVVGMGHEAVALTPLQTSRLFIEDEPRKSEIQAHAVRLFKVFGLGGRISCARIDFSFRDRTDSDTSLAVRGVASPAIFHSKDNAMDDDFVISEAFPGGHAAFFDMLVTTQQVQRGQHTRATDQVAAYFDKVAPTYDSVLYSSGLLDIQKFMAANFEFSGTVLDVPCGTGPFGNVLNAQKIPAKITGIEISRGMIESPNIKLYYQQPIRIGPMQEQLMSAGEFDHIVCFSGLQFLPREQLSAVLARMFMLARKSVTFEVDDLDPEYLGMLRKHNGGDQAFDFNNVQAVQEFGIPKGWCRVYRDRKHLYTSPTTKTDVFGYLMRFERQ